MRLDELLKTGALNVPWPVALAGTTLRGSIVHQSPRCSSKCGASPACASLGGDGESLCPHGMTYYPLNVLETPLVIYGVRGPSNPNALTRNLKDVLKGRYVDKASVDVWVASIEALAELQKRDFLKRQSELLDPLHDLTRLADQIEKIAMAMLPGGHGPLNARIEGASTELKSLIKASGMLSDYFELLSIYFNPDSASFGKKVYTSVHGVLLKIVSVLGIIDERGSERTPKIILRGESYRNVELYESFKLMPFAIISNAVKYCLSGNIRVDLTQVAGAVQVAVSSIGPLIESDEFDKIFERRSRGKWAASVSNGTGVGLYLAAIVARAHMTKIHVSSKPTGEIISGVPAAQNRFWFELAV